METNTKSLKEEWLLFIEKIQKYKFIAATAFLLPIIMCAFYAHREYPAYKSTMLIRMNFFTNNEMSYFYSTLSDLLDAKDYATIEERFFIEEKYAVMIRKIALEKIKDKPDGFVIALICNDTSCIRPVEKGIVYFMENNKMMSDKINSKRDMLSTQLDSVISQMNTIDTLIKAMRSSKGISTDVYPFYAASATMSLLQLNDKRLDLTDKLNNTQGFSVIDRFIVPQKPEMLKINKYLAIGFLIGSLSCYLLIREFLP